MVSFGAWVIYGFIKSGWMQWVLDRGHHFTLPPPRFPLTCRHVQASRLV
jgi:hypothetical protein